MSGNARGSMLADTEPLELVVAGALASVALIGGVGWLVAQTAATVTGGHLTLSLAQSIRGLIGWHRHLSDPRRAFPLSARRALPGPALMYLAVGVVVAVVVVGVLVVIRITGRVRTSRRRGYATGAEIRRALSRTAAARRGLPGGRSRRRRSVIALGVDLRTRQPLFGAAEDSYLYLGPPRSGKGVHLIIPQTIDAPGAALVTATRPDTLRHTLTLRAAHGPVMVFDPQHLAGDSVPRLRWAPQHGCTDPLTAISRARALAAGAQLSPASVTDAAFWQGMTEAVLRCYLHAAALDGRSMRDVLTWTARPADPTPVRILRTNPDAAPGWVEELTAQAAADPRQRDSVWAGVRRAVDSLADPRVLDSCSPPEGDAIDLTGFLHDHGTLYLLGTTGAQLTVAPLVTALVEALLEVARTTAGASTDGFLDPGLTLLLDEAANIAPIPSLPNLLADGGGSGITAICVLQSLAQARARWGQAGADAMWDAATTKVILGGLAHAEDLQRISQLAGDIDDPVATRTHGSGGASTSVAPRRLPALPAQAVRTLPPGHALILARRTPPVEACLTPWWNGPHAHAICAGLTAPTPVAVS
ncbi:MAG TPA: TraM recognition domain-containing protein [Mycobacteriales bacterium]|nr:TraM recognition domain-containing protein [Mycobacteriales bacterium]